jgi:hypothetical protein
MAIDTDNKCLLSALIHQDTIGCHNILLRQTAKQFGQCQQNYILETQQWNSAAFWAKILTLALWELKWTIWKTRNEIVHGRMGVARTPARELNASIEQEWKNGTEDLLAQDQALIQAQGTTLPRLLQTQQGTKLPGWHRSDSLEWLTRQQPMEI